MTDTTVAAILVALAVLLALISFRAKRTEEEETEQPPSSRPKGKERKEVAPPPPPEKPAPPPPRPPLESLPRIRWEEDEELELTKITVMPSEPDDDDEPEECTERYASSVVPIVYDEEAAVEEPTGSSAYILVSAVGQTDPGMRRRRNEDAYLMVEDPPLFVVADGMGGYAGGDIASAIAVETFAQAFSANDFDPDAFPGLDRRASALVQVIRRANRRIHDRSQEDRELREMGTTLICARFSPNKQRVYLAHVGDSRAYVYRDGELRQITTDHTAAALGVKGRMGQSLTRALGVAPSVLIDVILGKPRPYDRYLLCSDGLSKMISDETMAEILAAHHDPDEAIQRLIDTANESGGKDNITVIVVRIDPASTAPTAPCAAPTSES